MGENDRQNRTIIGRLKKSNQRKRQNFKKSQLSHPWYISGNLSIVLTIYYQKKKKKKIKTEAARWTSQGKRESIHSSNNLL
jgi:hypothetical protein